MNRTPDLDRIFGAEYDAHPVLGLTRDEYIAKRYAIAERRIVPVSWSTAAHLFPSSERSAAPRAPGKSAFDWTAK